MQTIFWLVASIPEGNVATYGQIAELAGMPRRARLIAQALAHAPEAEQLPWYRVVRADGRIATHAAASKQAWYLQREGVTIDNGRINLKRFQWVDF
ncbi:MAG: cysteine methyltransferase [Gammaproteobacteria bacterium]|nr:cysteine methyltransferase [Gammaproteobacteria bacterium]